MPEIAGATRFSFRLASLKNPFPNLPFQNRIQRSPMMSPRARARTSWNRLATPPTLNDHPKTMALKSVSTLTIHGKEGTATARPPHLSTRMTRSTQVTRFPT